jgi:hypothetical protein
MKGLERRMARAEKRARGAEKRFDEPSIAEHQWACRIFDRYFELVTLREMLLETDGKTGVSIEMPDYSAEEALFLADCAAGGLQRAQDICDRFERARGRVPWSDMTPIQRERELARLQRESDRLNAFFESLLAEYQLPRDGE